MTGVLGWTRGGFGLILEPRYVAIVPPSLGFVSFRHGDLQDFGLFSGLSTHNICTYIYE